MGNRSTCVGWVNMPKNRSFLCFWQSWSPRFFPASRSQRGRESAQHAGIGRADRARPHHRHPPAPDRTWPQCQTLLPFLAGEGIPRQRAGDRPAAAVLVAIARAGNFRTNVILGWGHWRFIHVETREILRNRGSGWRRLRHDAGVPPRHRHHHGGGHWHGGGGIGTAAGAVRTRLRLRLWLGLGLGRLSLFRTMPSYYAGPPCGWVRVRVWRHGHWVLRRAWRCW